jgi:hypothetical protein
MTVSSISPVSSAALQILQQPILPLATATRQSETSGNLGDVIHTHAIEATSQADQGAWLAHTHITEALFSANSLSISKLKVWVFERTGQVLGVEKSSYKSDQDYGLALQRVVSTMTPQQIAQAEKEIGLDKLHLSLQSVIAALLDPTGEENKKMTAALHAFLLETEKAQNDVGTASVLDKSDDIGVYSVSIIGSAR